MAWSVSAWLSCLAFSSSEPKPTPQEITMPFTNDELVTLSADVWELLQDIEDVRALGSAQGKKITKAEARRLMRTLLKLASRIVVDVID